LKIDRERGKGERKKSERGEESGTVEKLK